MPNESPGFEFVTLILPADTLAPVPAGRWYRLERTQRVGQAVGKAGQIVATFTLEELRWALLIHGEVIQSPKVSVKRWQQARAQLLEGQTERGHERQ